MALGELGRRYEWALVHPDEVHDAGDVTVPALLARHPAQRRLLRYGVFWKETHARLALAARIQRMRVAGGRDHHIAAHREGLEFAQYAHRRYPLVVSGRI